MRSRFHRAPVTFGLLLVITAVFGYEWWTGVLNSDEGLYRVGGIIQWEQIRASGEYWRVITGMFLHASVLHWAANSWALYQLGTLFEAMFASR
jgi:membrane associated rhomboid family serine protease